MAACLPQTSLLATVAGADGTCGGLALDGRTWGSMQASGDEGAGAGAAVAVAEADEEYELAGKLEEAALWAREAPPGCVTSAAGTRRAGPMMVNLKHAHSATTGPKHHDTLVGRDVLRRSGRHGRTCWLHAARHQTA